MAEVEITKASEVKVREIEWLWYPYIPFGKVTVLQGDAGDGKSTFVLGLAAMLSRGLAHAVHGRHRPAPHQHHLPIQ